MKQSELNLNQLVEHVRQLGKAYGYGAVMQLCEKLWRELLLPSPGGELTVGPCAAELVMCPHIKAGVRNIDCDWCCATGRVTKRVAEAMLEAAPRDVKPPWVLFVDGSKKVILPAGRLGEIADVSWMTLDQADAIVRLANERGR